jgi:hypothetical protein
MPRSNPAPEDLSYSYKRPFFNQKIKREEAIVSGGAGSAGVGPVAVRGLWQPYGRPRGYLGMQSHR